MNSISINCYCSDNHQDIIRTIVDSAFRNLGYLPVMSFRKILNTSPSSPFIFIIEKDFAEKDLQKFVIENRYLTIILLIDTQTTIQTKYFNLVDYCFVKQIRDLQNDNSIIIQILEDALDRELNIIQKIIPITANLSDCIAVFNKNLEVKYLNKQFKKVFNVIEMKTPNIIQLIDNEKSKKASNTEIAKFIENYEAGDEYILRNQLFDIVKNNQVVKHEVEFIDFSSFSPIQGLRAIVFKPIVNMNLGNSILVEKYSELIFLQNIYSILERPGITISGMFQEIIIALPKFLSTNMIIVAKIVYSGKIYKNSDIPIIPLQHTFPISIFGHEKGQLILGSVEIDKDVEFKYILTNYKDIIEKTVEKLTRSIEVKLLQINQSRTLGFQNALYEISSRLLDTKHPENEIDYFMGRFTQLLGSEFIAIALFKEETSTIKKTFFQGNEYCREYFNKITTQFDSLSWFKEQLFLNGFFKYSPTLINEKNPDEFRIYEKYNLSLHVYILESGSMVIGFMLFAGLEQSSLWSNNYSTSLYIFTNIFAGALERKRINIKIMEQYLFLRNLIDSIPTPVLYTDKNGKIIGANQKALDYLMTDLEELSMMEFENIKNKYKIIYQDSNYLQYIDDKILRKDTTLRIGENERHALISESDYFDSKGEIAGTLFTFLDITDLKSAQREILATHYKNERLLSSISSYLIVLDENLTVTYLSNNSFELFGFSRDASKIITLSDLGNLSNDQRVFEDIKQCMQSKEQKYLPTVKTKIEKSDYFFDIIISSYQNNPFEKKAVLMNITDITERIQLERKLQQAQKLESIGQLAAGIAHEINTPSQYITDNLSFLMNSYKGIEKYMDCCNELLIANKTLSDNEIAGLEKIKDEIDLNFLRDEIPQAISQSIEGSKRITKIVLAMKDFSHPGVEEKTLVDINHALESTITIARNEWKYSTELFTELDDNLPQINCYIGEINQVFLNLIINATHSIIDANKKFNREMGRIDIKTNFNQESIFIAIEDNGLGIPAEIKEKVYDPFFTTKEIMTIRIAPNRLFPLN